MERRDFLKLSAAATLTLAVEPAWAQTAKTEIHWLGQATTKLTTASGKVIVIDPFLTNNPKTPQEFKNLDKLDIVGIYPNYATAYAAWKAKAQQTVDNAHMRYFIVHMHRLIDRDTDRTTAP